MVRKLKYSFLKVIFISLITSLACGCQTPYKKLGMAGGYSEAKLGENKFKIHFSRNGFTTTERARDFVLRRNAEVTLENGFKYFIIDSDNTIKENLITRQNLNGPTLYGTMHTNTNIYVAGNDISCFKERPKTEKIVYDASFISDAVKKKYQ